MPSLVDHIWMQLRAAILQSHIKPGARLVELEIAEQMGTSQGPVREALQRLEQEGLVERRARNGTFVTSVSVDEMREIFSVRSTVEGFAIRRTATRITADQLDELEMLIQQMRTAGHTGDMAALVEHDMQFHRCICEWSQHTTLLRVWAPLYTQVQRFIFQTHPRYFHDLGEIADTHWPVLEALRSGDPEQAAARIHEHIMLIWARIEADRKPAQPERDIQTGQAHASPICSTEDTF